MTAGQCYEFGAFRLNAGDRLLFRGRRAIPLPPKVAETLTVLVENSGQVLSKEELLRRVWPNTFVEEGSLTRTISILRNVLDDGSGQEFIATLPKRGYRFSASVGRLGGEAPSSAENEHALIEEEFKLTDRLCRKLNRATLDPLLIGDHLRFADNQVDSDVLVFFLHGLGLDHRDFEPILAKLAYRGVSPTLYGCEPERRGRISLSLADHVVILRELLRECVNRLQPTVVVLVGFSMGADMGFELLLGPTEEPGPVIGAFLSLECNICLDTCTISQVLAGLPVVHPEISVADLQRLGGTAASLEQWLNIHEYLVRVLRKFQGDVGVLQRAAADIVKPFCERPGFEVFARWFLGARARVQVLRVIFPKDSVSSTALARLRFENLDKAILGGEFPETEIQVSTKADHFDLMSAQDVLQRVDELVTAVRASRAREHLRTSA